MDKMELEKLLSQLTLEQLLKVLEAWEQLARSQSKNFLSSCRDCYVLAA